MLEAILFNFHTKQVVDQFVSDAHVFELIDRSFDKWAPDVHYGKRTVRPYMYEGREVSACDCRDNRHLIIYRKTQTRFQFLEVGG